MKLTNQKDPNDTLTWLKIVSNLPIVQVWEDPCVIFDMQGQTIVGGGWVAVLAVLKERRRIPCFVHATGVCDVLKIIFEEKGIDIRNGDC